LIEGAPMMMTPPSRRHQRIASNLESLLNAALRRHSPLLAAYHDIGVIIVSSVPYDPEPDMAVIREGVNPDPRYADRFYLVAEVLSESDKGSIENKRDIYGAHPSCTCILLVRQDRLEITVERRTGSGWHVHVLLGADELALPDFGLACLLSDVYRDTRWGETIAGMSDISKMPGFRRRRPPVVVVPIHEANRGAGELAGIRVVEARNVDRAKISAEHVEVSVTERVNAAVPAENMVPDLGAELVVRQSFLARDQAKRLGFDNDAPISHLDAEGAVTPAGASAQIDVGLKLDLAAMATASIRLGAHGWRAPHW
jgi:Uma2 family endonuclease